MSKPMSYVALFVVVVVGAGSMAACGGGSTGPNELRGNDDTNATQELPGEVESGIELDYHRKTFTAFVDADREYCIEGRTVIIFRDAKKDVKVGRLQTDIEGEASLKDKNASGKYFARLLEEASARYGDLSLCLGDKSKLIRV